MTNLGRLESYSEAIEQYLEEAGDWITAAHIPWVHHARVVCQQLDAALADSDSDEARSAGTLNGHFLRAVAALESRRPRSGGTAVPGDLPGQGSIFDELTD